MICDATCGYCRREVKSAHGIEALYMYFNGSGIWGGETIGYIKIYFFFRLVFKSVQPRFSMKDVTLAVCLLFRVINLAADL